MRRFWVERLPEGAVGIIVTLSESESRHIARVLRMQVGDMVELVDGTGNVYAGLLNSLEPRVAVQVLEVRSEHDRGAVRLTVAQGWLKGQKMETVIQKCTELGVSSFMPFWSSRCQGKLKEQQGGKKLARYQRVVEAACKQCYRPDLMAVEEPVAIDELATSFPTYEGRMLLLFWEEEREVSLHEVVIPPNLTEVVIALGPEGGLSRDEAELFQENGFQMVSLGSRVLRAETATLAAVSLMQFLVKNI